jgi:hypothetical protein
MNELWDTRMLAKEPLVPDFGLATKLGFHLPPIRYWDFQRLTGVSRMPPDPLAGNSWHRYSAGSYGLVYPRTALVMHDLEARLGGDAFARGMKLYYRRWHHRHPSTADLRQALVDAAPEQRAVVEQVFEQQVYGSEPVDDVVDTVEATELLPLPGTVLREGKRVELTSEALAKEIEARRAAFKKEHGEDDKVGGPFPYLDAVRARRFGALVPQTLLVEFADGSKETIPWPANERWHRWTFERPVKITSARLDPDGEILLDVDKLDDGRTREAHRLPAIRWSLEGASWAELLLSLLGAL